MASLRALVITNGRTSQIVNADTLLVGSGIDANAAGTLTIGGSTQTAVTISRAGILTTVVDDLTVGGNNLNVNTVTYSWPAAQGAASTVLTNNGSGTLTWAAAGGGGVAIGGTVTSGTAGSILFVGAGPVLSQNNANFFWDDTNARLGVGTTAPTNPLSVDTATTLNTARFRTTNSAGSGSLRMLNDGTDALTIGSFGTAFAGTFAGIAAASVSLIVSNSSAPLVIETLLGQPMIFGTTDVERMRIAAGGNISIGSATTTSLFNVGSAAQFRVNSTGNIVLLNNVITSFPSAQGAASTVLTNNGSGTLTWAAVGASMAIGGTVTGGTTGSVLFIGAASALAQDNAKFFWDDTSDRLGIGTTAPAFDLHVASGAASTNIQVENTLTTGVAGFRARNNAGDVNTLLMYGATAAGTTFGTSNNSLAALLTSGAINFAIGTPAGVGSLVFGTNNTERMSFSSAGAVTITAAGGTTINTATVTFPQDTDFVLSGGVNGLSIDGTTFSVDALNDRIGIGTAAPGEKLSIISAASGAHQVRVSNSNSAGQATGIWINDATGNLISGAFGSAWGNNFLGNTVGNNLVGLIASNAASFLIETFTAQAIIFGTTDVERMRIFAGGNVSIGTTSDLGQFAVDNGATSESIVVFRDNGTTKWEWGDGGNLTLSDAVNITVNATTGTKIGTTTTGKLGFFNAAPVAQQAGIPDATGGAIVDTEARAAVNAVIAALEALGFTAVI